MNNKIYWHSNWILKKRELNPINYENETTIIESIDICFRNANTSAK